MAHEPQSKLVTVPQITETHMAGILARVLRLASAIAVAVHLVAAVEVEVAAAPLPHPRRQLHASRRPRA